MAHNYTGSELTAMSATEAVNALEKGDISPLELIDAALDRISAVEPAINALPTICADRAREKAKALKRGEEAIWLAGLPIAIKDLTPVAGVPAAHGARSASPISSRRKVILWSISWKTGARWCWQSPTRRKWAQAGIHLTRSSGARAIPGM